MKSRCSPRSKMCCPASSARTEMSSGDWSPVEFVRKRLGEAGRERERGVVLGTMGEGRVGQRNSVGGAAAGRAASFLSGVRGKALRKAHRTPSSRARSRSDSSERLDSGEGEKMIEFPLHYDPHFRPGISLVSIAHSRIDVVLRVKPLPARRVQSPAKLQPRQNPVPHLETTRRASCEPCRGVAIQLRAILD